MPNSPLRVMLAACLGACLLAGCAQTMVNSGPSSVPPSLSWIVQVADTGASTTVNGSGTATVPRGTQVRVFLHATSSSGVKTVTDGPFIEMGWTCIQGNIGQNMTADIAGSTATQTPNAQNQVDLDLVLFHFFDVTVPCNAGFSYSGGAISINGKATTFAGKSKTASLVIKIAK